VGGKECINRQMAILLELFELLVGEHGCFSEQVKNRTTFDYVAGVCVLR